MNYSIEALNYGRLGSADKLQINIGGMSSDATKCQVSWQVGNETEITIPGTAEGSVTRTVFNRLDGGQLWLDDEAFTNWGADNYYVVQWAATQLGFTLL